MAKKYGRTWWGEQWLNALDRIDFSNRLPRGRNYANKGMVSSITIAGNVIEAKVKGSMPKPYNITIVVPPLFDEEKNIFIDKIKQNPLIISQLLNRQLPKELLEIAEQNNIKIFPQSWQDIKLNCSCPDWAVPCKHLAAVIYIIANEIDQNPFLVFSLHRFDLVNELAAHQIQLHSLQAENIFSIRDCIANKKITGIKKALPKEIPDFSLIENLLPTLPLLFTSNPLFYDGDFKTVIQNFYKRQSTFVQQYFATLKMSLPANPDTKKNTPFLSNDFRYYDYTIIAYENGELTIAARDSDENSYPVGQKELLTLLSQTESKHLGNYSLSFTFLYRIFRFCSILAERGALLPRLFKVKEDNYRIQWIPALLNASIKKTFDDLLEWYPMNMMQIQDPLFKGKQKKARFSYLPAKPEEALILLCSFFNNNLAEACYNNKYHPLKTFNPSEQKINDLFFNNTLQRFDRFTDKEIPNTIQLWLNRFYISEKDFTPVLQVHEIKNRKKHDDTGSQGFELEILIKDNTSPLQFVESLYSFMKRNSDSHLSVLKDLQILSNYLPELNHAIASKGKEKIQYNSQTFAEVLTGILPAIRLFGIQTLLPKSLQYLLKPQVTVSLNSKGKNKQYFSLNDLLDYDWMVAMGDSFITKEEFFSLANKSTGLVKIRDQYIMMNREEIEKVIKKLSQPSAPKAFTLLQAALSGDYEGAPVQINQTLKNQINEILKSGNTDLPSHLKANLRHYQVRGFNWLYKNSKLGLGSLLADDMGLGKTLQVICTLLKFKEDGALKNKPALVVAPTTLLSNWKAEIEKFAPSLNAFIFHGSTRKTEFKNCDIVITTYGIVRSETENLSNRPWYALVIDEAQNIKNNNTAQTKAIKKIKSDIKIAMSGTPVENRLMEYWSIFDFTNPGYLGSINWFNDEYAKPIEINQDKKRLNKFRSITSPFIMRRVKTDKTIISDLPDKIENNQICNLTKEQAALYKGITQDLMKEIENTEGINRRGIILKLLTILKQVCNHPLQYLKNGNEVKPEQSGKMMLLFQLLETIYENGEKVLIFSQYREMGDLLRSALQEHFGKKALQLHGGNSRKERDEIVQSFQNNPLSDTFILSLKAGGTGLNLTAGNHVIHYDLWWNPAVEAQATDRAFRIGQKKNVMVHRMITKGTLEEKIDDMLHSKKNLANLTVANGEKWIGELSDGELKKLITLSE